MKKWIGLLMLAALIGAGCDGVFNDGGDGGSSGGLTEVGGVWDLVLLPTGSGNEEYLVTVEIGGGSGAARVSINGPLISDQVVVTSGTNIAIGTCGLFVRFGAPAEVINLVVGDSWRVAVIAGSPNPAIPGLSNTSTVSAVASGGSGCAQTTCDGSALESAVPFPDYTGGGAAGSGGQWYSVRLSQNGPQVSGAVAEQHALSLNLGPSFVPPLTGLIAVGDTVTISYRRRIISDGANGDFFRTIVTNSSSLPDVEYLDETMLPAGDTVVSLTFTAQSSRIIVDFIAGLSSPGEAAFVDDVQVSTAAGGLRFSDGFSTGPGIDCGPTGARWTVRSPAWEVGSLCVSSAGALTPSYSARWSGGSYRQVSGSILDTSSSVDLASLLGGGMSGFGGSSLTGLFLEAWETPLTYFLTVFAIADNGQGTLAGTFKGESNDHSCLESGQLTATRHAGQAADVSSRLWVTTIQGQANNCNPALAVGDTVLFAHTLETLAGDTQVAVSQLGQVYFANGPVRDGYTNQYSMSGTITGGLVTMSLAGTGTTATGIGSLSGDVIQGALTGSLVFDGGRVCAVAEGSGFEVRLVSP